MQLEKKIRLLNEPDIYVFFFLFLFFFFGFNKSSLYLTNNPAWTVAYHPPRSP